MQIGVLEKDRRVLLRSLAEMEAVSRFYLAGGTALSLQLGLRKSYDFDFFTGERFNSHAVFDSLRQRYSHIRAIRVEEDTCDVIIEGVQVSFFNYPYPLVCETIPFGEDFPGLKLASVDDISAMKLSAIGSRGSRKDFYDLYQIYRRIPSFDSRRLLENAHGKFGMDHDLTYMIVGMSYFDDAEEEILPEAFIPADWQEIKAFFRKEQKRLFALEEHRVRDGGA